MDRRLAPTSKRLQLSSLTLFHRERRRNVQELKKKKKKTHERGIRIFCAGLICDVLFLMSTAIDPYHAAATLDLKRGWTGMKITKMANDHRRVPLYNNDKRYDSGKDLSYLNFPRNKQKMKANAIFRMHDLFEYTVYARQASF